MSELKNKFMDLLFDEEPEQEISEEYVESDSAHKTVEKLEDEDTSPLRAKDILFHKSSAPVFINVDDSPKTYVNGESADDVYEMSSQISPIFGVIRQEKKKSVNITPEITESQTSKPADSHLDIITSPIYGYGNKEDAIDNNYDVKAIGEDEEEELHQLFDENEANEVNGSSYTDDEEISLFRLFGENK